MKKLLLSCSALVAMVATASAADLARRPLAPAMPPAPVYNWNGFYLGAQGGYAWSDHLRLSVGGFDFAAGTSDLKGGFFGGTIGYNFQSLGSPFVWGLEADAGWADIKNSRTGFTPFGTATIGNKIDALGSVTGRLGYAWGPGMIYAKGGYAWANNQLSAVLVGPLATVTLAQTEFHSGWTIGGGLEYLFAPNWSGKVEYMYADFGNVSYVSNLVPGGVGLGATLHTIKGGINYHFNWDNGPVVARY